MYPTGAEEQTTESASRRADIPGQEDEELAKKQAVAYPYHYLYPGYTMAHGIIIIIINCAGFSRKHKC